MLACVCPSLRRPLHLPFAVQMGLFLLKRIATLIVTRLSASAYGLGCWTCGPATPRLAVWSSVAIALAMLGLDLFC